jgi:hypothetical protein
MSKNTQSRKWSLVINNLVANGLSREDLLNILNKFSLEYYCLSDEVGKSGTEHTHIFMYSSSPIRFTTIKNRLPIAHIEKAYGSAIENRDYIMKSR